MAKQRVEIEVDVPDGFEVLAWRVPLANEEYLSMVSGTPLVSSSNYGEPRFVVRKVEPVRESRWRRIPDPKDLSASYLYDTPQKAGCNCNCQVERIDYENGIAVSATVEPSHPSSQESESK